MATVYTSHWMLEPHAFAELQSLFQRLSSGEVIERRAETQREAPKAPKAIAVIPIVGVIAKRPGWYTDVSSDRVGEAFDAAISDDRVKSIVLDIDSPGGQVYGTPELARKIYDARGTKPVVGIANSMAASALYYIGSAADRLYVTPSGDVGSIGVYTMHVDQSKMLEELGIKVSIIKAGKFKAEGNPFEPLSDEGREYIQRDVDDIYADFVADVAKQRGVSKSDVVAHFGEGRTLSARNAVAAGMADGVATFEQVVARLRTGHIRTSGPASEDDWTTPVALIDDDKIAARHRRARIACAVRKRDAVVA